MTGVSPLDWIGPQLLVAVLLLSPIGSARAQANAPATASHWAREIPFDLRYGIALTRGPAPAPRPRPAPQTIGRDKVLHFTVSAGWTGLTYVGLDRGAGWPHGRALGVSTGSAAALGIAKELHDATTPNGDASGKDLLANALGIGAAVGLILGTR